MKTYLTEAEAGKHLKISRAKLVDMRKNAGLPHIRIGSRILYDAEEVEFWLSENCRGKAESAATREEKNNE